MAKTFEELELENEQLRQENSKLNQRIQKMTGKEEYLTSTVNYYKGLVDKQTNEKIAEYQQKQQDLASAYSIKDANLEKYYKGTFDDERKKLISELKAKELKIDERILHYETSDGRAAEIGRLLEQLEKLTGLEKEYSKMIAKLASYQKSKTNFWNRPMTDKEKVFFESAILLAKMFGPDAYEQAKKLLKK